jgi:hypothetical protein
MVIHSGPALSAFSFGGGVQSMAALCLAKRGVLHYKYFIFSDVGDDSENPGTVKYLNEIAIPYAKNNGLNIVKTNRVNWEGKPQTLMERILRTERSIDIPVRGKTGKPGARKCTGDFKVKPVANWMRSMGANEVNKGIIGVGISIDEWQRMKPSQLKYITNEYPLVDLEISREDCVRIIQEEGLPVPPKSSCWFCSFHKISHWVNLKNDDPELFSKVVNFEKFLQNRCDSLGRNQVYITQFAKPIEQAVEEYAERWSENSAKLNKYKDPQESYDCGPFTCDGSVEYNSDGGDGSDSDNGLVIKKIK